MRVALVLVCAAAAVSVAACSSSGGGTGTSPAATSVASSVGSSAASSSPSTASSSAAALSGSITVYAASSLTEAFGTLGGSFTKSHPGTHVTFQYGASSDLATQLTNGAPADVFASASPKNMASVKTAVDPVDFVSNVLEIATPPKNPAHIAAVADLAKSGVKVALCAPAVPCGAVAVKVFANAHITVHASASEQNVKATLATVEAGEVDAGVVYVTDVRSAGTKVHGVPIAADVNAATDYPIAALSSSKNAALAKAFVAYIRSTTAKSVLQADGFRPPT